MPTRIDFQTWDGGSGIDSCRYTIGYCKEEPLEVLKSVMFTHHVYHYKDLYMPIDRHHPNNVQGLVICQAERISGVTITGNLSDLDLSDALSSDTRTKDSILNALEECRKWHTYDCNKTLQKKRWDEIDLIRTYVQSI